MNYDISHLPLPLNSQLNHFRSEFESLPQALRLLTYERYQPSFVRPFLNVLKLLNVVHLSVIQAKLNFVNESNETTYML